MTDDPKPARIDALQESDDPKLKELKARAQHTHASLNVKHDGPSERFLKVLNDALDREEMVKIRFVALKDQKKGLSRVIEQMTGALLVQRVGHTATYYRAKKQKQAEEKP